MKTLLKIGLALGVAAAATMMAEVEKVPDRADASGKEPTVVTPLSAADVYLIPNKGGDVQIRVINGVTADTNVTIKTPNTVGGNAIADKVVQAKKEKATVIGPFDPAVYNNAAGFLEVSFSAVANVSMELQKVAL